MIHGRRQFFRQSTQMLLSALTPESKPQDASVDDESASPWLRPPGALDEPAFLKACTRCTDCIEACPHDAIHRLGPEFGDAAGTPAIIPSESPCYLCDGMPCIPACEPNALAPVEMRDVTMGTARIDLASCYAAMGQPCDYCVVRCPLKNEAISFDDQNLPVVNEKACTGCGVCAYLCPPNAIHIRGLAAFPRVER